MPWPSQPHASTSQPHAVRCRVHFHIAPVHKCMRGLDLRLRRRGRPFSLPATVASPVRWSHQLAPSLSRDTSCPRCSTMMSASFDAHGCTSGGSVHLRHFAVITIVAERRSRRAISSSAASAAACPRCAIFRKEHDSACIPMRGAINSNRCNPGGELTAKKQNWIAFRCSTPPSGE